MWVELIREINREGHVAPKLGVGPYEMDRPISPSVQKARLIFLRLLDGFKPLPTSETTFKNVAPASLHDDVFLSFTALVIDRFWEALFSETPSSSYSSSAAIYLHLRNTLTPEEVQGFIPNHSTLERESPTTHEKLVGWARRLNIDCDWCLDFAVEAMRSWLFDMGGREFKLWGRAIKSDSHSFVWDAVIEHITEEQLNGNFSFVCGDVTFSADSWNYRLEEADEWRGKITGRFLTELRSRIDADNIFPRGFLSKLVSRFEKEVEKHIREAIANIKEQGYIRSTQVSDYSQFAWTICYQVLGMKLLDVSREFNQPQKTVEEGINRTLTLLGLKKRPRGKPGRRPSVVRGTRRLSLREEINKKTRLMKFIESYESVNNPEIKAAIARKIGVSEDYFRRVWVPHLLDITGCKDYETLIQRSTITAIKRHHSELLRM